MPRVGRREHHPEIKTALTCGLFLRSQVVVGFQADDKKLAPAEVRVVGVETDDHPRACGRSAAYTFVVNSSG